jgi:glycosyltransferase involved in cell wall biosynthesis
MRILFVTHCFPPLAVTASQRSYGWARAWADAGHDVHVVTPEKYAFDGDLGLDLPRAGVTVHEVRYAGRFIARPAARIGPAAAAAGDGGDTGANGTGGGGSTFAAPAPTDRGDRERSEPAQSIPAIDWWSRMKRITRRLRFAAGDFADPRLWAVPALIHTATTITRDAPFDLLVSTFGPASAHVAAGRIAARTGLPWVADYQDLWSRPYAAPRRSRIREHLGVRRERRLMRRAAMFVTLSQGLADRLRDLHGRDCEVAYFGYDDYTPVPPVPPVASILPPDTRLRMVYTGRVYPEHQPLAMLFAAIGDAARVRPALAQSVAVDFYGPEQQDLRRLCARYRTEAITHFHGMVPHARALGLQRGAAAALWFDWADAGSPGVLTCKVFEYLRSGRPIVAINAGFPSEAIGLIASLEAGRILSSREEIARFLLALPDSLPARPPLDQRIERLSNRQQGLAILETIQRKLFTSTRA